MDKDSLSHTSRGCACHVARVPRRRRKVPCGETREVSGTPGTPAGGTGGAGPNSPPLGSRADVPRSRLRKTCLSRPATRPRLLVSLAATPPTRGGHPGVGPVAPPRVAREHAVPLMWSEYSYHIVPDRYPQINQMGCSTCHFPDFWCEFRRG